MRPSFGNRLTVGRTGLCFSLALAIFAPTALRAQQMVPTVSGGNSGSPQADFLPPAQPQQSQATSGTTFSATAGQDLKNPSAVVSSGSLWQEKYGLTCTQRVADPLTLSYETSSVMPSDSRANPFLPAAGLGAGDDLYREQTAGFQFQPLDLLTLRGNVHNSSSDFSDLAGPTLTTGTGFSAEGKLPFSSTLKLDLNSDRTGTDLASGGATQDTTCNAQYQQPLGKMPLSAVLKGHYEQIRNTGAPASQFPSMEQSLVWKPVQDTTLQMGLRQQQYEETPGISDTLNQALFADWSQSLLPNMSWHSYAEMMNSRQLQSISLSTAPQATAPGSNPSLNSAVPVSFDNETLTFTTGPAFKLKDDLSAAIEYSSRWDTNPQAGDQGEEQRLSVSLKGTF